MKNLNEEINRFRELLLAEHGVIKPYKSTNNRHGLFSEQAPQTTGDTASQTNLPPLPPPVTPAPPNQQTVGTGPVPPPLPPPVTPAPPTQQTVGTGPVPAPKTAVGSGPVPAPSTGSTAPQPAQPTEAEFYEEEDFDDFEDDNEDEMWEIDQMLQDAIEEGRDILEYEADMTNDELNELSELDIAEELREIGYDDLADSIEEMYDMVFNK